MYLYYKDLRHFIVALAATLIIFSVFLMQNKYSNIQQTVCLNSTETLQAYNACMEIDWNVIKSRLIIDAGL